MIGALEAGGTKCVCAMFTEEGELIERVSIPTQTPDQSIPAMIEFFKKYPEMRALGIGSFGPIGVNESLDNYGYITTTPKAGWQNFNFVGTFKKEFDVPIAWTTDVNAAAYGEMMQGAAQGLKNVVYLTVGTGIGGGFVVDGNIVSGYGHPESGHILIRRHEKDTFEGTCPYHKDCLEGMAAGPAIEARWGKKGFELEETHQAWEIEADYIAQALYNYYVILGSEKFILGGGVMKQRQLFPLIKQRFVELNNGYLEIPAIESFIVPPALEDNAGITGCYELAKKLVASV
ncbi:ROK family protein [Aerococcaceae bacterium zg-B36]|uniref:ROK family protein n=1 Tax=Aerococcaceae bacterium zg-252 TaxID=2796928 RepID=UPI001BD856F4|nr:ROK family protein [Aerococcaceae bacterium zg-B36]